MKTSANNTAARSEAATPKRMPPKIKAVAAAIALAASCASLPAFAQGNAISPGYLTGVWKENAHCGGAEAMTFFPNNTMSSAGSIPVNYTVTGPAQFTMHGPGGVVSIPAQYVNPNQMVVTFQNNASVFYRCGGTHAPAPVRNTQLTPAYLVGGWGHNGNCSVLEVFAAGGPFRSSNNDAGTWGLFGNIVRITLGNGASLDFSVQPNGPRNMMMTQTNNGQVSHYTRCF